MSKALPGEHYCIKHQCNYSHYAEHNCTVCKLQTQLEAAKQRELELLAVIEKMRNAMALAFNKITCDPKIQVFATLEEALEYELSQALREHDAKVLEDAADWFDEMFYTDTQEAKTLRRMAEERRNNG